MFAASGFELNDRFRKAIDLSLLLHRHTLKLRSTITHPQRRLHDTTVIPISMFGSDTIQKSHEGYGRIVSQRDG